MKEQSGKAVTRPGVYHNASEPPTYTWWSDQKGIYFADRDSERIAAYSAGMSRSSGRLGHKECLPGWRRGFGEVDFDVRIVRIPQRCFRQPGQEI